MAKSTKPKNISIRPSAENLLRLDALCNAVADSGLTVRKSTMALDAFVAGLDVLEEHFRKGSGRRRAS